MKTLILPFLCAGLLVGCMAGNNYKEIYVAECDYTFKEVQFSGDEANSDTTASGARYVACQDSACLASYAILAGIFKGAEAVGNAAQQSKYWHEFKQACAEKGIKVTKHPQENRIYLNKRTTKTNHNDGSELSDIERR